GFSSTGTDLALASNMEATLWASNFKRPGYGFVGWSDTYDYVANVGSATNPNAKIYGPNETITTPTDLDTKGLSLYAVWVESAGTIQNWNGCNSLAVGQVTALTDLRDNNTYAVAKLKDGRCWMIENLRLDNTAALSSINTDNPSLPLKNNYALGTTSNHLSTPQDPRVTAWCLTQSPDCYDQSMFFSEESTTYMVMPDNAVYSYGNYYNWYSATAGHGTFSTPASSDVAGSICPKGWRLPSGELSLNTVDGDFGKLTSTIAGSGPNSIGFAGQPIYYGVTNGVNVGVKASNDLRSYPNNYVVSSYIRGDVLSRSYTGSYWSSTNSIASAGSMALIFTYDSVYPGNDNSSDYHGRTIRCIAR
ncbi:hypothetical protein IKF03_01635, partial [Candidatus Saccharibacteria bacterium]|nr:hypothetical protein [Candidatus Saccharibacteria bacterium]